MFASAKRARSAHLHRCAGWTSPPPSPCTTASTTTLLLPDYSPFHAMPEVSYGLYSYGPPARLFSVPCHARSDEIGFTLWMVALLSYLSLLSTRPPTPFFCLPFDEAFATFPFCNLPLRTLQHTALPTSCLPPNTRGPLSLENPFSNRATRRSPL